jgi:hypothetical protein
MKLNILPSPLSGFTPQRLSQNQYFSLSHSSRGILLMDFEFSMFSKRHVSE